MSEERRTRLEDFEGLPAPLIDELGNGFRLEVLTGHEVLDLPDPPSEWALLGPLVYRGNRTVIVGDTGHGKTSLALQMIGAVVRGEDLLGYRGAGVGPALVLDLEQGVRSIKRGLREANLDRDDVLLVSVPDGLALDREVDHLAELDRVLAKYRPAVVLLDPYYKAHRSDDPNAERPIIDLMRRLDGLRASYGFALILPAHPRKDVAGAREKRRLTLHDVAGSGAVTRGAEIVLAIERLNPGASRLRYLKDRDGELPVDEAVTLSYSKEKGYRITGRGGAELNDDELRSLICSSTREWRTVSEWRQLTGAGEPRLAVALDELEHDGLVEYAVGPEGKRRDRKCWRPVENAVDLYLPHGNPTASESVGLEARSELIPTLPKSHPPFRGGGERGVSEAPADKANPTTDNPILRELP